MGEERGRRRRRHTKREAATAKLLLSWMGEGERGNGKGGDEDLVLAC